MRPIFCSSFSSSELIEKGHAQGSLFGLKSIARAFQSHGFVGTLWKEGPADGLGAMVGAFWCHQEASQGSVSMHDSLLMHQIGDYNEVDCIVMMEAINYLRREH